MTVVLIRYDLAASVKNVQDLQNPHQIITIISDVHQGAPFQLLLSL